MLVDISRLYGAPERIGLIRAVWSVAQTEVCRSPDASGVPMF